jgi:hypothetical protein
MLPLLRCCFPVPSLAQVHAMTPDTACTDVSGDSAASFLNNVKERLISKDSNLHGHPKFHKAKQVFYERNTAPRSRESKALNDVSLPLIKKY